MPNHVTNKLTFTGDQKIIDKMLDEIKNDEEGIGSIDFNKLIPMPDVLKVEAGSMEEPTISAYLSAINPTSDDFGIPKMKDAKEFNELFAKINDSGQCRKLSKNLTSAEVNKHLSPNQSVTDYLNIGKAYVNNFINHGATSWYSWSEKNWGTKWNSYSTKPLDGNTVCYETAWSCAMPVIQKLSTMYPELEISFQWADEDIGVNVGEVTIKNGDTTNTNIPEESTKEAYELAAEIKGEELASWGLAYNDKIGTYEYNEEVEQEYFNNLQLKSPQMSFS